MQRLADILKQESSMKKMKQAILTATTAALILCTSVSIADEGRYQAYWNGKSYFILDTDKGHMWNYFGDTMMYNGKIDGDDLKSPAKAKIWKQSHGRWVQQ